MVAAEAFLTTAQKRNSVVRLAKSLNYTPRSTSASTITGTITASVSNSPVSITIPKNTEFTGRVDNTTFKFLTQEALTVYSSAGYVGTVTLKEGTILTRRYTVSLLDLEQRFLIPNSNIDTTTISVSVLNSSTNSTTRTFVRPDNLVEINGSSQIYFLEEINCLLKIGFLLFQSLRSCFKEFEVSK
jgi:hypothetical protein